MKLKRVELCLFLTVCFSCLEGCSIGARYLKNESADFPVNPTYYQKLYSYDISDKPEATTDNFISAWGPPQEIISKDNSEFWVYKKRYWCGPIILLPLMLPACHGYEKVLFESGRAKTIESKAPHGNVLVIIAFMYGGTLGFYQENRGALAAKISKANIANCINNESKNAKLKMAVRNYRNRVNSEKDIINDAHEAGKIGRLESWKLKISAEWKHGWKPINELSTDETESLTQEYLNEVCGAISASGWKES